MNIENDFPMKKENIVYFDNAATSLKPKCVIDSIVDYYECYSANIHRGDYNISFKASDEYEYARETIREFINASSTSEIVFTKGTTDSLNMIVECFFKYELKEDDEIILSKSEHASNIIPWMVLAYKKHLKIKYVNLNEDYKINLGDLEKTITSKTKVISLAHITNVIGDERNIKEISSIAHKYNIYLVVDAAQSIAHTNIDVKNMNIDFLAFSGHKICGPTGIGVMYAKKELLDKMIPCSYGGGMNEYFDETIIKVLEKPYSLESGTPNISGVIGLNRAIKYINNIGIDYIKNHERYLRKYLIKSLKEIPYIKIYNELSEGSIVLINIEGILSGDLGLYLNSKNICVRSGNHCAKMLKDELKINDTVRISLSFYNTYEEIDILIKALKDKESLYKFIK